MSSTDRHWAKWGAKDPYYGVVSHPQFRSERIEQNRDLFFRSGEEFIGEVFSQAERCFGGVKKNGIALDFGCGVARLTIPLAQRLGHVDGFDVSPRMLEEARGNCKAYGVYNVDLHLSNGDFDRKQWSRMYDFVNSYIVLQHIPVRRGYAIIDTLLGLVADRGIAMLHVSLRRNLPLAREAVYQIRHRIPFVGYAFNLLQWKPLLTPQMQMNEYDLIRVLEIFTRHRMKEISITLENHRGVETARLMAQKRA